MELGSIGLLLHQTEDGQEPFLTDVLLKNEILNDLAISKCKKEYKKPSWDDHKSVAVQVSKSLAGSTDQKLQRQSARISKCAEILEYGWVFDDNYQFFLRLFNAHFCRVRSCPICQWRRSLLWVSRFFDAFPLIHENYQDMRYFFLTLTVENCPVTELRSTIQHMNKSFERMTKLGDFPALGYVRSLEVTKERDLYINSKGEKSKLPRRGYKLFKKARPDYCHPHFHVLCAVPPSYFGRNYLSTKDYAVMWQKSLRSEYTPVCDVRIVKPKDSIIDFTGEPISPKKAALEGILSAVTETVKYTLKPSDMVDDPAWFHEVARQLHKMRAVSLGGVFKQFFSVEDDDLILESKNSVNYGGKFFGFRRDLERYQLNKAVNPIERDTSNDLNKTFVKEVLDIEKRICERELDGEGSSEA